MGVQLALRSGMVCLGTPSPEGSLSRAGSSLFRYVASRLSPVVYLRVKRLCGGSDGYSTVWVCLSPLTIDVVSLYFSVCVWGLPRMHPPHFPAFTHFKLVAHKAFIARYTCGMFYGRDSSTVWPDSTSVTRFMLQTVVQTTGKTCEQASELLSTPVACPSRPLGATKQQLPGKVLRVAIAHFMTALKKVAADAFYNKFHDVTMKRTFQTARERKDLILSENINAQWFWNDNFIKTEKGRMTMRAVVRAAVSKWANIRDFRVAPSALSPDASYSISTGLYMILVFKIWGFDRVLSGPDEFGCRWVTV